MDGIYRLPNTKERTDVCKRIAADCYSLFTSEHFIKRNTTFFRIIGDYLMQCVSICYPSGGKPYIAFKIFPLYEYRSFCWLVFNNIRSIRGLGGITPEEMLGIQADPIYHSFLSDCVSDYNSAFKKELSLLENQFLPMANSLTDARSCLQYFSKKQLPEFHFPCKSVLMLRCHDYHAAQPLIEAQLTSRIKHLARLDIAISEGLWTKEQVAPGVQTFKEEIQLTNRILQAIASNDSSYIDEILSSALTNSVSKVEKISKKLVNTLRFLQ